MCFSPCFVLTTTHCGPTKQEPLWSLPGCKASKKNDEYQWHEERTHTGYETRISDIACSTVILTVGVQCLAAVPHLQGSWPANSWCCWLLTYLLAPGLPCWSSPFWFSRVLLQWCALLESSYLPVWFRQRFLHWWPVMFINTNCSILTVYGLSMQLF